ncbi:preprotein translocase subunit SecG [Terrimonas sp. NA20]|uniref:Protein-export membrane protein SecG n=1 Tax=Terrimonas ginsenosidimutans TaxID=2908004 RepID=A0ABS9KYY5_9BACT|nr:preprotein translocase subunit SecG [Terrimonas ginsenosidimutans]MCG2617528.1 preprotein translocase subunit SecG [Terrimonas ginsenosidimutans]
MSILFVILVILASVVLALFVLIQNPKGGGLAGNIAGFSNQFMGVKQTTDVLEKGTWIFAGIIGVLCLVSALFIRNGDGGDGLPNSIDKATGAPAPAGSQAPSSSTTTFPAAPTGDSVPK